MANADKMTSEVPSNQYTYSSGTTMHKNNRQKIPDNQENDSKQVDLVFPDNTFAGEYLLKQEKPFKSTTNESVTVLNQDSRLKGNQKRTSEPFKDDTADAKTPGNRTNEWQNHVAELIKRIELNGADLEIFRGYNDSLLELPSLLEQQNQTKISNILEHLSERELLIELAILIEEQKLLSKNNETSKTSLDEKISELDSIAKEYWDKERKLRLLETNGTSEHATAAPSHRHHHKVLYEDISERKESSNDQTSVPDHKNLDFKTPGQKKSEGSDDLKVLSQDSQLKGDQNRTSEPVKDDTADAKTPGNRTNEWQNHVAELIKRIELNGADLEIFRGYNDSLLELPSLLEQQNQTKISNILEHLSERELLIELAILIEEQKLLSRNNETSKTSLDEKISELDSIAKEYWNKERKLHQLETSTAAPSHRHHHKNLDFKTPGHKKSEGSDDLKLKEPGDKELDEEAPGDKSNGSRGDIHGTNEIFKIYFNATGEDLSNEAKKALMRDVVALTLATVALISASVFIAFTTFQ